jgi:hypothetical protein
MTNLYRHFDKDGVLLYVGISICVVSRLYTHSHNSRWFNEITRIDIDKHETREDAEKAEEEAIKKERPKYNVMHARKTGITPRSRLQYIEENRDSALHEGVTYSIQHPDGLPWVITRSKGGRINQVDLHVGPQLITTGSLRSLQRGMKRTKLVK